jgi:transposase
MARFIGLDVSQKRKAICIIDDSGRRLWHGRSATDLSQIARRRGACAAHIGLETSPICRGFYVILRIVDGRTPRRR